MSLPTRNKASPKQNRYLRHTRSPKTRIKGLSVPPREPTSPQQRFQEAKPADIQSSGQFLHVDLDPQRWRWSEIGFHCDHSSRSPFRPAPRDPRRYANPLLLQADKGQGISTHAQTLTGTKGSGKGPSWTSQRYPQEVGPTPRKIAIFPFPDQSVLKYLPSGEAFKKQDFLSYSFTQGDQGQETPNIPLLLLQQLKSCRFPAQPIWCPRGQTDRQETGKLPRSCNRAWGEAAARFLK